ncbi:hypothetical protein QZH41_001529 [Actinostola sp. cb2023]|nr:hypothetical protein QZH41_001529 [Actinostola sp. cb2023]
MPSYFKDCTCSHYAEFACECVDGYIGSRCHVKARSCLDYLRFKRTSRSGTYTLFDGSDAPFAVYCGMDSATLSAWTVVLSYALKYNHFFKTTPFYLDDPLNQSSPNWDLYRLSLPRMKTVRGSSRYWRVSCNYGDHGIDRRDYAISKWTDIDLLNLNGAGCRRFVYIDVRGTHCSNCTTTMSYIHTPHSRPLDHRTAFQILQTHAKQRPNKEALVFRDEKLNRVSLTFQEYDSKSSSLAAGLLEIGLVRGDKVLVLLPSYLEFVLFHMALNRIGAIMITPEENCYLAVCGVPDLACVIARVEPTVTDNDKVISEIKKALHQNMLKAAILVGSDHGDAESLDNSKAYTHEKLFAMAEKNPESSVMVRKAEAQVQMDDPCWVIFTSGSTSIPKPIQYTHHGYVNGVYADVDIMGLTQDSIFFSDSPFDWIAGVAFSLGPAILLSLTCVALSP